MSLSLHRLRLRTVLAVLAAALMLAVPAAASAKPAFTAKIVNTTHTPKANNSNWYLTLSITRNGKKISGVIGGYQFFAGSLNATCASAIGCKIPKGDHNTPKGFQYAGAASNHFGDFTNGTWRDNLQFPPAAAGENLQLRVLVKTKYGSQTVTWNITPKH